jgi:hypothetical protein
MTALIIAILDTLSKVLLALIQSQTPAQSQILWDRYIELTAPLHRLLIKIENLGANPEPSVPK